MYLFIFSLIVIASSLLYHSKEGVVCCSPLTNPALTMLFPSVYDFDIKKKQLSIISESLFCHTHHLPPLSSPPFTLITPQPLHVTRIVLRHLHLSPPSSSVLSPFMSHAASSTLFISTIIIIIIISFQPFHIRPHHQSFFSSPFSSIIIRFQPLHVTRIIFHSSFSSPSFYVLPLFITRRSS